MHDALHRAAARMAFGTSYHDVWGQHVHVAPHTLAALLAQFGMGVHAPDDDAAWDGEVRALDEAQWRQAVPPVALAQADASAFTLTVRLPLPAPARLGWTLIDEDGGRQQGDAALQEATEHGRAQIEGVGYAAFTLQITARLPMGYHRLSLDGHAGQTLLIAAPPRCHLPEDRAAQADSPVARQWGVAAQLYALRSE
ncbi:MAG: hypothetical protein EOO24_65245, partial [Comamonadaceae bacterium]